MPSPTVIRYYAENCYYHVYNRGVEKRLIFLDEQDYRIFLFYLFIYLASPNVIAQRYPKLKYNLRKNNLAGSIELLAYCLMPNHFHFLLKQIDKQSTTKLMRRLTNSYTRYFNSKYYRVGSLMQGKFKSKLVASDEYLLYLSAYIHRNPIPLLNGEHLETYQWSSYREYLGKEISSYVNNREIAAFFSQTNSLLSYQSFVTSDNATNLLPVEYMIDDQECATDLHATSRSDLIQGLAHSRSDLEWVGLVAE